MFQLRLAEGQPLDPQTGSPPPQPGSVCARSAFSESNVGRPPQKLTIWTPKHYKLHREVVTEVFLNIS